MKICIDPGHNYSGWNTGATGCGLREQDISFYIGDRLKSKFESVGIDVVITRPTLTTNLGTSNSTSLSARYKLANNNKCDLFISIHCNASSYTNAKGTEVLYRNGGSIAHYLAQKVQASIVNKLGTNNRRAKQRTDLAVLNKTSMPAILVETAFITNDNDANKLANRQEDFAEAIFEAVCDYYGISYKMSALNDIEGHWAYEHIKKLYEAKIVTGDTDGKFYPNSFITKAMVATMAAKLLSYCGVVDDGPCKISIKDINGHWAYASIIKLASYGIISGDECFNFNPDAQATRAMVAVIASNVLTTLVGNSISTEGSYFTDVKTHWAKNHITKLANAGIITGDDDGNYHPDSKAMKCEVAAIMSRILTYVGK